MKSANYLNQFEQPGKEFRGRPFWAWNCKLDRAELRQQLSYFKEMGMGGVTIHCRTGLDTDYMSEEFLDIVSEMAEEAKQQGLMVGLYDEDRWPSGFAGGEVTKHPEYQKRALVFSPWPQEELQRKAKDLVKKQWFWDMPNGNGSLLARYHVELKEGYLLSYRRLEAAEAATDSTWYAFVERVTPGPKFNDYTYVDVFNQKAIEHFLAITHEKYFERLGSEFGKNIPSVFSDEPQFTFKQYLGKAEEVVPISIPYTDDMDDSYQAIYGVSMLDTLPELFWERADGIKSLHRYRFHAHTTERFAKGFAETIGSWCDAHNLLSTGHMMEEPTLYSQTSCIGEAMRHYHGFGVPGIDMLADKREYTTAKQAQSAVHQLGKNQMMCEIYGVTNWDFDFRGHKQQGDWLAALGVTERVHHLAWVSMAGESKRDYPASIFYQSPWYKEYQLMETYFARVNTALRSGKPHVQIGVIHPVESMWLAYGPAEHTGELRENLERQFKDITDWLLFDLLDFDYISEALLEIMDGEKKQEKEEQQELANCFLAGEMAYECVIVPACIGLRRNTLEKLEAFASAGGRVIFLGDAPSYVDGNRSEAAVDLWRKNHIPFTRAALQKALEDYRDLDLKDSEGLRSTDYIYQMRDREDGSKVLFIANARRCPNPDTPRELHYSLMLKGNYWVEAWNPIDGSKSSCQTKHMAGKTILEAILFDQDSLLLHLTPGATLEQDKEQLNQVEEVASGYALEKVQTLHKVHAFSVEESNVLVLDQCQFALDGGDYEEAEEMLRLDKQLRERVGYPLRTGISVQPYMQRRKGENEEIHTLSLRFAFQSETTVEHPILVLEELENARVLLDNKEQSTTRIGFFVDHAIPTMALSAIMPGQHELVVELPFTRKTKLEWCYILGNFGVRILGNEAILTDLPKTIAFGPLKDYGFPFYGGNFTYEMEVDIPEDGDYVLEISKYRAPLLRVSVDGCETGTIIFAPSRCGLGKMTAGRHRLTITAYGNRINTFGQIHNSDETYSYFGPDSWRTEGGAFAYEYQLRDTGVLCGPVLYRVKG